MTNNFIQNEQLNEGIVGCLPFKGKWRVGATPAHKIPSHGTSLFGVGYAYDFTAVDEKRRSSSKISWKAFFSSEAPENFYAFGKEVLSPVSGKVISIHNGELDHNAYRSLFTLIPYALGQKERIKKGVAAIAGNHIIIKVDKSDYYIAIVHLQCDSILVEKNQTVVAGEPLAHCGNSGNSIEPHIHIQAMTSTDFLSTKSIPLYFEKYYQSKKGVGKAEFRETSFPEKGTIISQTGI